jgi:hypothetical protein
LFLSRRGGLLGYHATIRDMRRGYDLEFKMSAYIPALIWLLSAVACDLIAKRRDLKKSTFREMAVALMGPFAIPWLFMAKPEKF